jgi:hypothetical protein
VSAAVAFHHGRTIQSGILLLVSLESLFFLDDLTYSGLYSPKTQKNTNLNYEILSCGSILIVDHEGTILFFC